MTPRDQRHKAQQAYSEWLGSEKWDLFLTLTDPGLSHPEAMLKRTRYFFNSLNVHLYGSKWWKRQPGVEYVIGLERQKRGSVHSHSVCRLPHHDIQRPDHVSLKYWQKFASDLGGFSWLEIPRSSSDTLAYVTKYVAKEGEIYLSPSLTPTAPRAYSHTLQV